RRNGRLVGREWANRRMKSDQFEIPGSCGPIRGEAYVPDGSLGAVVVCHGFKGFAHGGFFPYLAQRLWERSLTAITFDFSGTGIGADRLNFTELERCYSNTYLKELSDLESVIGYTRKRGWIPKSFGLFGHSRGGGVPGSRPVVDRSWKS